MLPNKSLTQNDLAVWGRLGGIKNTPHEAGRGLKGVNRVSWAVFREDKMLKRHLSTAHGLGVNEYRERWTLPADYPYSVWCRINRRTAVDGGHPYNRHETEGPAKVFTPSRGLLLFDPD